MAERNELKSFLKKSISLKDMLMSDHFKNNLQYLADSSLLYFGFSKIPIRLIWDNSENSIVACISDKECVINLDSVLDQGLSYIQRKKLAFGKLTHEVFGHGLYTDFKTRNSLIHDLEAGIFSVKKYFQMTSNYNADLLNQINLYYKERPDLFIELFFLIENIVEDPTVEYLGTKKYPGFKKYVAYLNSLLVKRLLNIADNSLNVIEITDALLMQARNCANDKVINKFPSLEKTQVVFDNINNYSVYVDRIVATCYIFNAIWNTDLKFVFDEVKKNKKGLEQVVNTLKNNSQILSENEDRTENGECNKKNPRTNPSTSNPLISSIKDSEKQDVEEETSVSSEDNDNCVDNSSKNKSSEKNNFNKTTDNKELSNDIYPNILSKNIDKLIEETSADFINRMIAQTLNDENSVIENNYENNIVNDNVYISDFHKNYPFKIHKITSFNKEKYNLICNDKMKSIARNLSNKVIKSVKTRQKTNILYEQDEGQMIDINAYANASEKCFMNINQPNKKPVMACTVMVDQSGSMSGERCKAATNATIVLERFCRDLKIPVHIYGHNETVSGVQIYNYIEHSDLPTSNRAYKLTNIKVDNACNRDGFSIRYGLAKLLKRSEPTRILFIISDGAPNSKNYGVNQAIKDVAEIKNICKRKKVTLIALAIGDDIDQLKKIYGSSLVDARNLNDLPKNLTTILLKKLKKVL